MNKVVFIIPYFGKLPSYFHVWQLSAINNKDFDFLFFTDIEEIESHNNIHVVHMSFKKLREIVQSKFSFNIELSSPYKLCDFKPAYGYIFADYIKQYMFWGHCDIDIILGKLSLFITQEILEKNDKVYEHGHMTLYRNNNINNLLFKSDGKYPEYNYKEVYRSLESFYFDEFYGMMLKCRRLKIKTYLNVSDFFDVSTQRHDFFDVHDQQEMNYVFEWSQGHLYAIGVASKRKREIAYAHFQKRDMDYSNVFSRGYVVNQFFIVPNKIIFDISKYTSKGKDNLIFKIGKQIDHIKDFIKRYRKAKTIYSSMWKYYKSRQAIKERKKVANILMEEETCSLYKNQDFFEKL